MKKMSWMLLVVIALGISGCAQKSESEKMLDQMHKDTKNAVNQMKKDMNKL